VPENNIQKVTRFSHGNLGDKRTWKWQCLYYH